VDTPARPPRTKRRTPQRAVPQSVRRSGKPLFFGWGAHLTHHEREQVKERIAASIGVIIALTVIALLVNGWVQDNVVKPAAQRAKLTKPVAKVGSTVITNGWYHKVLKYQTTVLTNQLSRYQSEAQALAASKSKKAQQQASLLQSFMSQLSSQQAQLPQTVYQQMIANQIVLQRGGSAGLHVTAAAKAKFLHNIIYKQAGGPLKFSLAAHGYSMTPTQLKSLLLADFLNQKMQTVLAAKVPSRELQVHARNVLVSRHALAVKVERQLKHGASWKALAAKYNTDSTKSTGGDLGWASPTSYVPPFRKATLHWRIGAIGIVHSQFGYHVLEVLGRQRRKLSASQLSTNKQQALQAWIAKEEAIPGYVHRYITPAAASPLGGLSGTGLSGLGSAGTGTGTTGTGTTGNGYPGTGTGSGSGSSNNGSGGSHR